MNSIVFDSFLADVASGAINPSTDTFYAMLTTDAYIPNTATHTKRSNVTNEVVGTGYTAGGFPVTLTVVKNTTLHRLEITLGGATLPGTSLTCRNVVYYKRRGGASSADELVAVNDAGMNVTTSNQPLQVTQSLMNISTPVAA